MPRRRKKGSQRSRSSAATGSTGGEIHPDWYEFLSALISHSTRFVLIGGHAVAVHAEARFTEDLDVFVEPSAGNARRLRAALVDFGFGEVAPSLEELTEPERVFMLGRKPYRIDILTSISGVRFATAWKNRTSVAIGELEVPVLGRAELQRNKRASGRDKDLFDLKLLAKYGSRT
jgi:hypothetical protein